MPRFTRGVQRALVYTAAFILFATLWSKVFSPKVDSLHPHDYADYVVQDIKVVSCNKIFGRCGPPRSSKRNLKLSSVWVKIPKDLTLGEKLFQRSYIYKEMIPASEALLAEVDVVLDIAIENEELDKQITGNKHRFPFEVVRQFNPLLVSPSSASSKDRIQIPSLEELKKSRWMNKGDGLWIRTGKYQKDKSVTDLTVLFGRDCVDPRANWNIIPVPLPTISLDTSVTGLGKLSENVGNHSNDKEVYISYTKSQNLLPHAFPKLKINTDGTFKILQIADLHFSTGYGHCRDTFPEIAKGQECLADLRTLKFVEKVLDIEKPDLIVLTGDQIFGDESPDSETSMYKVIEPFIKRKIPYAMTFGNHDDEGSLSRSELVDLIKDMPYSLTSAGPSSLTGVGNYILPIASSDDETESALILYFLDSHKYSPKPKTNPGYDWMKEDQVDFIRKTSSELNPRGRLLSMAFFHIPLTEYREGRNTQGDQNVIIGSAKEGVTGPSYNTFMKDALVEAGVSVVTVGHDHCNDFCMLNEDGSEKIWLCYGGAAGEGGYGGYGGTTRRIRTFSLNTKKNSIETWKRLETTPQEMFDIQKLV